MLDKIFGGENDQGTPDTVDRIVAVTEKIKRVQTAVDVIRYDEELYSQVPGLVVKLGAAKDSLVAELKTL